MKRSSLISLSVIITLGIMTACGDNDTDSPDRERVRQDSLAQVRSDSMEQQRQDSLAKVRQEREETSRNPSNVTFSDDGRYSVQVESWRSEQKARQRALMWEERGFRHVSVVQYGNEESGDVWFRVRLGRLDTREQAKILQQTLQDQYQADAWIETL